MARKAQDQSPLNFYVLSTGQKDGAHYLERSINDQFFLSKSQEAIEKVGKTGKRKEEESNLKPSGHCRRGRVGGSAGRSGSRAELLTTERHNSYMRLSARQ